MRGQHRAPPKFLGAWPLCSLSSSVGKSNCYQSVRYILRVSSAPITECSELPPTRQWPGTPYTPSYCQLFDVAVWLEKNISHREIIHRQTMTARAQIICERPLFCSDAPKLCWKYGHRASFPTSYPSAPHLSQNNSSTVTIPSIHLHTQAVPFHLSTIGVGSYPYAIQHVDTLYRTVLCSELMAITVHLQKNQNLQVDIISVVHITYARQVRLL